MGRPVTLPRPPRANQRADWADAVASARRHPEQWIKVKGLDGRDVHLSKSVPRQVRRGNYAIDPTEFELTSRSEGCEPGSCQVYLRTRPAR